MQRCLHFCLSPLLACARHSSRCLPSTIGCRSRPCSPPRCTSSRCPARPRRPSLLSAAIRENGNRGAQPGSPAGGRESVLGERFLLFSGGFSCSTIVFRLVLYS